MKPKITYRSGHGDLQIKPLKGAKMPPEMVRSAHRATTGLQLLSSSNPTIQERTGTPCREGWIARGSDSG
ncbi:MAG: hypothetical protein OXF84_11690 [Bacteroidetes bacterium]|nr:hypothetical protein [Bacteroidota bacterium]